MELVADPLSLIGFVVGLVVQNAKTLHLVVVPLSIVKPSILIEEFPLPMSLSVKFVPFILAAHLEVLNHELRFNIDGMRVNIVRSPKGTLKGNAVDS